MMRPSSDLRNNYAEVSEYCHETGDPVFITKNGRDDLVVMSVDAYERIEKQVLLAKIERGVEQAKNGNWRPFEDVMADIRREMNL